MGLFVYCSLGHSASAWKAHYCFTRFLWEFPFKNDIILSGHPGAKF